MPATPSSKTLVADLSAGLVVSLVALPLCLGVALASNAPLFSGVVAGIIGGILVGAISQSQTSVSGPAAGLTAVVASQIAALGSFEAFLTAVVLAGALQVVLGLARAGSIADFVPSSVIKGLLAAIGLILILKQLPHLVGHDTDPLGEMAFEQPDDENTLSELARAAGHIHPGAAVVGFASIALLYLWDASRRLKKSLVPGPLVVVVLAVLATSFLEGLGPRWAIEQTHLVQVPVASDLAGFIGFFQMADFRQIGNPSVFVAAITIALVASLETLLNLEAVDKLDPQKRVSPPNRELIAQGVGNITAGLIGGIPVTSVIVRSSVNINAGGKTKLSTITHGILLLVSVLFLPTWLNRIPLSCLAAILIVTGVKLASPKLFRQMLRQGIDQAVPFLVTIVGILMTDLLIGILLGLGVAMVSILRSNWQRPLRRITEKHIAGEVLRIELASQVSFLNRAALTKALEEVPAGGEVTIDARYTSYIDTDVLSLIQEFKKEVAPARGIRVNLVGFKDHYEQQEEAVQVVDFSARERRDELTPEDVLRILDDGNRRFRSGQLLTRDWRRQREDTAADQHPLAIVLSGTSSRTPVEMLFDMGLGNLSCVRTTGNSVAAAVLASLEYGVVVDAVKVVVVMGHTNNDIVRLAIQGVADPSATLAGGNGDALPPHVGAILEEIQKSIDPDRARSWVTLGKDAQVAYVDEVSREHVRRTIRSILERSQAIANRVERGDVKIVGCMYDVQSGLAEFFDGIDPHAREGEDPNKHPPEGIAV
jgi:carbonic anhydrase